MEKVYKNVILSKDSSKSVVIKVGVINCPNSQNSIIYVVVKYISGFIFLFIWSQSCTELYCQGRGGRQRDRVGKSDKVC